MKVFEQDSDIHFGERIDEKPVDWRVEPEDTDPDDERLENTPADVIGMLGFDPAK